jgi:hypothetical protein
VGHRSGGDAPGRDELFELQSCLVDLPIADPGEQRLQGALDLESCDGIAEAVVQSVTEGPMGLGSLSGDVEDFGVGVDALVVIG